MQDCSNYLVRGAGSTYSYWWFGMKKENRHLDVPGDQMAQFAPWYVRGSRAEVCKHSEVAGTEIVLCVLHHQYHNADYLQESSLIVLYVLHCRYHDADYLQKSSLPILCVLHRHCHDADHPQKYPPTTSYVLHRRCHKANHLQKSSLISCTSHSSILTDFCLQPSYDLSAVASKVLP